MRSSPVQTGSMESILARDEINGTDIQRKYYSASFSDQGISTGRTEIRQSGHRSHPRSLQWPRPDADAARDLR